MNRKQHWTSLASAAMFLLKILSVLLYRNVQLSAWVSLCLRKTFRRVFYE